ncbi:16S rRNA (cytosine(1402)-N(4))-methyltransferase RsmH [Candidatus Nomurabacteria bacterium]|nr:16S rRNA (cytosine(1402)-N(4))-methyltransferase RsmH [Candidatus Nomurabacteria bacterium]
MHIPVLLHESITALEIKKGDVVVDGTFGGGGHSKAIYESFGKDIKLICVDLDEDAKERFEKVFKDSDVVFVQDNYKNAKQILSLAKESIANKILLDIGTSSFQLDQDSRGFSFNSDSPLAMTLSKTGSHTGFNAYDIVNTWEESSIADIIYYYGEETFARKIAKAIVSRRKDLPIKTSKDLADLISNTIKRKGKLHPATKTFQALRIAVNDELNVLKEALDSWWASLGSSGRIAVITFHSLEDRIVKQWMKNQKEEKRVITKKPITPNKQELEINPRSRSAKLRIIEKI